MPRRRSSARRLLACWAASLSVSARGPAGEAAVVAQVQLDEHEHLVQAVLTQCAQARLLDVAHRCHRLGDEPDDAVRGAVPGLPGEQGLPETVALGDPGSRVGDAEGGQQRADLTAGQTAVGRAEDVGNALDDVLVPGREPLGHVSPCCSRRSRARSGERRSTTPAGAAALMSTVGSPPGRRLCRSLPASGHRWSGPKSRSPSSPRRKANRARSVRRSAMS